MSEKRPMRLEDAILRLPEHASADDALGEFMDYVASQNLSLYPAQEEALLELSAGKNLILNTPTGSGKSLVAAGLHFFTLAQGGVSYYTSPIKALASEKFFALSREFGAEAVGMITGDAAINPGAKIICCTAEILANVALREGRHAKIDAVIMDEFHYYADRDRGSAWQIPLLALPQARFLLMSATLGEVDFFAEELTRLNGRETAILKSGDRPVPLDFNYWTLFLHEAVQKLLHDNRAPVYLVCFTQRAAAEEAQNLMSVDFVSKEHKRAIAEAMSGVRFDTPYGKEVQKFIRHGLGLHHAGLLPKYRLLIEKLAQKGLLKIICGTDTLGVGVNIPIRSVLFTKLCKFDGEKTAILSVRDFKQISGRAGRKGFDDQGSVVALAPEHVVENQKLEAKAQAGKKVVKKKPPDKGYVPWDEKTFLRLVESAPESLQPTFAIDHGTVLNVLADQHADGGYRRLVELIAKSHTSARQKHQLRVTGAQLFRSLVAAGIVVISRQPLHIEVHDDLQGDFSLHHALSLYLLETLPELDRESGMYPLHLLTLVEAILENPDVILYRQLDKLKTEQMALMKAEGVPFDERIAKLDEMEYPKPEAEFVYGTFNQFRARHPWVGQNNIRPKSIARDCYERYLSFHEYVREYGLQRSEGVLLRYFAQVYKVLVQTVPDAAKTEEALDVVTYFQTMLRQVDTSLIDEWEGLKTAPVAAPSSLPARPVIDVKTLRRRIRSELGRLVQNLAKKNYEEAAQTLAGEWTAETLEHALAPFCAVHQTLVATGDARSGDKTVIDETGAPFWQVTQILVDDAEDNDFALELEVDPQPPTDPAAPLLMLKGVRSA